MKKAKKKKKKKDEITYDSQQQNAQEYRIPR